jgi:hypothetical protein
MPKLYDEPCTTTGIVPKQHTLSKLVSGRIQRYPFSGMLVGDFLVLMSSEDAQKARNALKTFYRDTRSVGRKFTVRPNREGVWICRRVA